MKAFILDISIQFSIEIASDIIPINTKEDIFTITSLPTQIASNLFGNRKIFHVHKLEKINVDCPNDIPKAF